MSERDIVKALNEFITHWKKEWINEELLEVDFSLLREIQDFLTKEVPEMIEHSESDLQKEIYSRELEILSFILNDLILLRFSKIVIAALMGRQPQNMSPIEFRLWKKLVKALKTEVDKFASSAESKPFKLSALEVKVKRPEERLAIFCVSKSVEDFVAPDGYLYRGLKPGDIVGASPEIEGKSDALKKVKSSFLNK